MPLRLDPTVTLVNRLVDASGNRIPYTAMFDGESVVILDELPVPVGIARIIVHNSMFRVDPYGGEPQYKLGVKEWGLDVSPLAPTDISDELIDRSDPAIGPRMTIKGTKLGKGRPLPPPRRHDPMNIREPGGREDGAFPGVYGNMADPKPA